MASLHELERAIWKEIRTATDTHDASRLASLSPIADEIKIKTAEWASRFDAALRMDGKDHPSDRLASSSGPERTDRDFTGRPIRSFTFEGVEVPVSTYKDLLVRLANLLRHKFPKEFDRRALALGGRKRRYFSIAPRELKYAHELETGGLFVETNLNANLIVKNCYSLLRELGCDETKLTIR